MTIHTTVGVYPNGDMHFNGVPSENLEDHKAYNRFWRPGRALIIDGVVFYDGGCSQETLKEALAKIATVAPKTYDTQPYW